MDGKFVTYIRVSTQGQGISGLGMEAQQKSIDDYLNGGNWKVVDRFVEVESGKNILNRPQLLSALEACKRKRAKLLIAKLDRLSRNVAFIATLLESGIEFVACDFPHANRLTVHLLSAFAEYEREMISKRTKEALNVAKAKGVKLGNPNGITYEAQLKGAQQATIARKDIADRYAGQIYPIIKAYVDEDMSLRAIARQLKENGELTARGTTNWTPTAVKNILARKTIG